jgi:phasin family protein
MQNMATATPAAREHIQAQMDFLTDVSKNFFHTAQRLNEANMKVVQSIFAETVTNTQQLMQSNPQQALLVASQLAQPTAETINAFNANLAHIFAQAQEEIARTAEQHVPKTTQAARTLVQDVNKMTEEARTQASERGKQAYEHLSTLIERTYSAMQGNGQAGQARPTGPAGAPQPAAQASGSSASSSKAGT